VCSQVFFIINGLIRLYAVNNGKEICRQFFFENTFFSEYESFLHQKPSRTFVDVLEDTRVYSFSYTDMQHFYEVVPGFQLVGRKIAEQLFVKISERVNSFLTETPEVRYGQLVDSRPKVLQRIPQYMIASYLGITPEHLSRLRKKLATRAD
jgi:CRP-like cAMP-binding protein